MNLVSRVKRLEREHASEARVVMVCGADKKEAERQKQSKRERGEIGVNDTVVSIITGVPRAENEVKAC